MKIKFINHASVIFDCGDVKILTDPWYSGSAFNNGWDLLAQNDTDINDLDFNYLWYSHEHPDHFSIVDLKKISDEKKKNITILFQHAPDQKVKKFCERLGFKVLELPENQNVFIGNVAVRCGKEGGFDSWISVTHDGKTVLNINDCRLENAEELEPLKAIGHIDVLMTQFGWANWIGNSGDAGAKANARKMIYDKVDAQIQCLQPDYILPFASFCWFSHEENATCNEDIITIAEFVKKYEKEIDVITMYLNDEWTVGEKRNCQSSIDKWQSLYNIHKQPLHKSQAVSQDILQESFTSMLSKLRSMNDWYGLMTLHQKENIEGCVIDLIDTEERYIFDITTECLEPTEMPYDISMGSESFNYLMNHAWGRGTLMINGRFIANYDTLYKFLRQTHVYYGNNIDMFYPRDIKAQSILSPKCFVFETINTVKAL